MANLIVDELRIVNYKQAASAQLLPAVESRMFHNSPHAVMILASHKQVKERNAGQGI
jgi:hypothetical protein